MPRHWSPGAFHPICLNPYLGKWRISLGVIGILNMCLRSHTLFTYHQNNYIWQVLFIPYSCSDVLSICPSWDSNSFHDRLRMLEAQCFIRLATELYGQWWVKALMFLWRGDFHLTKSFTENLLLSGFELFSRQVKRVESLLFYPFSHRDTQPIVN